MERHEDFPKFWHAVFILLLLITIQVVVVVALYSFGIRGSAGDPIYTGIINVISCGIIFSLLMSYKNITYSQLFHPSSFTTRRTVLILVIPVILVSTGGMILMANLNNLLVRQFPMSEEHVEMFRRMLNGDVISIISICLVAPLIEEMLFRGIFLRSFLTQYRLSNAILLSSLLFAVFHFNIYQMVTAYVLGGFLGWLYAKTRSLWPSIIAHASYNAAVLVYFKLYESTEDYSASADFLPPAILLFSTIIMLLGLALIIKTTRAEREKRG